MPFMKTWIGVQAELMLSGCPEVIQGEIIDIGNDIIVLYGDSRFIYIPLHHLQYMKMIQNDESKNNTLSEPSLDHDNISYRKILMNARGLFCELSIGDKTLHGYITSIMNDYFTFFSPLHRLVYVSVNHVKYIVPYPPAITPFSLGPEHFPMQPASMPLSRTMDQQLKKMEGELVILNLEGKPYRAGFLKNAGNNLIELILAGGSKLIIHADHVKTVHLSLS